MRDLRDPLVDKYRIRLPAAAWERMGVDIASVDIGRNGAFRIGVDRNEELNIIAATGGGWDHVSVSLETRCPTWAEMELVARLFFKEDEVAVQYHVPAKDHINNHPYVLHWWRVRSKLRKFPMPPRGFV